jgi:hypothetical protein
MRRPPTDSEKAYQDARLQPHLDRGWSSGLFDRWRAQEAVVLVHDRLKALMQQVACAQTAAEQWAAADRYVREYEQLVLAIASAGDRRRLLPVDLWPYKPPRYEHTDETSLTFPLFFNVLRDKLGLFTEDFLLVNRHYTIMLAHVVVHPARITQASDLPVPYPWPFVIRVDQEETPALDRQHDLTTKQDKLADRIDRALRASPKQGGRATYGAQSERWSQRGRARYNAGAKAYRLTERYVMAAIPGSPEFKENKEELEAAGVEVPTEEGTYSSDSVRKWVSQLIEDFRETHPGLPPPRRGRPRRH